MSHHDYQSFGPKQNCQDLWPKVYATLIYTRLFMVTSKEMPHLSYTGAYDESLPQSSCYNLKSIDTLTKGTPKPP